MTRAMPATASRAAKRGLSPSSAARRESWSREWGCGDAAGNVSSKVYGDKKTNCIGQNFERSCRRHQANGSSCSGRDRDVGQRFIQLLENHLVRVAEVMASEQSAGKSSTRRRWKPLKLATAIPQGEPASGEGPARSSRRASFLGARRRPVAGEWRALRPRRSCLSSNARKPRMDRLVPLVIPEINRDHMELLDKQPYKNGGGTSPIPTQHDRARAGPGAAPQRTASSQSSSPPSRRPAAPATGVPSLDILGNVVPFVPGEEAKMESETQKTSAG